MSESNRTTARQERGPRNRIARQERDHRANPNIRLKLRPGRNPVFAELEPDDLRVYLRTRDGRAAEPWQLAALASMRTTLDGPLDVQAYKELRAIIVEHAKRAATSGSAR